MKQKLQGKTISLNPVTEEYLDFICEVESDESLWKYEESVLTDKKEIREKFTKRMVNNKIYDYVVCRKSDGTPVGVAYIWSYSEERKSWEIGYAILPQYQKQGFCTESVKLLLKFAFTDLKAHKVVGMCNTENISSSAIMEKVGMVKEGTFREELYWQGRWVDQLFYCILESEYK